MGGKDIFYFEIPEEAKPDKIVLTKGKGTFGDNGKDVKMILRDENGNKKEQNFY